MTNFASLENIKSFINNGCANKCQNNICSYTANSTTITIYFRVCVLLKGIKNSNISDDIPIVSQRSGQNRFCEGYDINVTTYNTLN